MGPIDCIDASKGFSPGFNCVNFTFPNVILAITTINGLKLSFSQPTIQVGPLLFGKRAVFISDKEFWICDDSSGITFKGTINKFTISGEFRDSHGNLLESVYGDLVGGVYFKASGELWIKAPSCHEITLHIDPLVASDENV